MYAPLFSAVDTQSGFYRILSLILSSQKLVKAVSFWLAKSHPVCFHGRLRIQTSVFMNNNLLVSNKCYYNMRTWSDITFVQVKLKDLPVIYS